MAKLAGRTWFDNCGGSFPRHSLSELKTGIDAGLLNEHNEYAG